MKSILSRDFRYVPSVSTDLKRTFARVRREQAAERDAKAAAEAARKEATLHELRPVIANFNARNAGRKV